MIVRQQSDIPRRKSYWYILLVVLFLVHLASATLSSHSSSRVIVQFEKRYPLATLISHSQTVLASQWCLNNVAQEWCVSPASRSLLSNSSLTDFLVLSVTPPQDRRATIIEFITHAFRNASNSVPSSGFGEPKSELLSPIPRLYTSNYTSTHITSVSSTTPLFSPSHTTSASLPQSTRVQWDEQLQVTPLSAARPSHCPAAVPSEDDGNGGSGATGDERGCGNASGGKHTTGASSSASSSSSSSSFSSFLETDVRVSEAGLRPAQWLGAPSLWARGIRGQGVRVAVFDTGLHVRHPCLRVAEVTNWTDESDGDDGVGHGTFVAGVVAGTGACAGAAPDAEVLVVKVFTKRQESLTSWFLDAFNYVLERDVDIVNLSVGGPDHADDAYVRKVRELVQRGVTVVSAIGNDGPVHGSLSNPADMAEVIGVGGAVVNERVSTTSGFDEHFDFSESAENSGKSPQRLASGVRVAAFSSRGEVTWGLPLGSGRVKPDLLAPAQNIRSVGLPLAADCSRTATGERVGEVLRGGLRESEGRESTGEYAAGVGAGTSVAGIGAGVGGVSLDTQPDAQPSRPLSPPARAPTQPACLITCTCATLTGTSVAAPIVTAALALLLSELPRTVRVTLPLGEEVLLPRRAIYTPALLKKALHLTSRPLPTPSSSSSSPSLVPLTEQGAGLLDVAAARAWLARVRVQDVLPGLFLLPTSTSTSIPQSPAASSPAPAPAPTPLSNARLHSSLRAIIAAPSPLSPSAFPAAIDYTRCPHHLPHCLSPLYHSRMAVSHNVTLLVPSAPRAEVMRVVFVPGEVRQVPEVDAKEHEGRRRGRVGRRVEYAGMGHAKVAVSAVPVRAGGDGDGGDVSTNAHTYTAAATTATTTVADTAAHAHTGSQPQLPRTHSAHELPSDGSDGAHTSPSPSSAPSPQHVFPLAVRVDAPRRLDGGVGHMDVWLRVATPVDRHVVVTGTVQVLIRAPSALHVPFTRALRLARRRAAAQVRASEGVDATVHVGGHVDEDDASAESREDGVNAGVRGAVGNGDAALIEEAEALLSSSPSSALSPGLLARLRASSLHLLSLPITVHIIPTPPRARRLLFSSYHQLHYPLAYVPRDDLAQRADLLDWLGDHPHTNYRDWALLLARRGYHMEVLSRDLTCFDARLYAALLLVDPEREYTAAETAKLHVDVRELGLSVLVVGEWYNEHVLSALRFHDANTARAWAPVTGGANIPALNELLSPFGIAFGDRVVRGKFRIGGVGAHYSSGTSIIRFPKHGHLAFAALFDVSPAVSNGREGGSTAGGGGVSPSTSVSATTSPHSAPSSSSSSTASTPAASASHSSSPSSWMREWVTSFLASSALSPPPPSSSPRRPLRRPFPILGLYQTSPLPSSSLWRRFDYPAYYARLHDDTLKQPNAETFLPRSTNTPPTTTTGVDSTATPAASSAVSPAPVVWPPPSGRIAVFGDSGCLDRAHRSTPHCHGLLLRLLRYLCDGAVDAELVPAENTLSHPYVAVWREGKEGVEVAGPEEGGAERTLRSGSNSYETLHSGPVPLPLPRRLSLSSVDGRARMRGEMPDAVSELLHRDSGSDGATAVRGAGSRAGVGGGAGAVGVDDFFSKPASLEDARAVTSSLLARSAKPTRRHTIPRTANTPTGASMGGGVWEEVRLWTQALPAWTRGHTPMCPDMYRRTMDRITSDEPGKAGFPDNGYLSGDAAAATATTTVPDSAAARPLSGGRATRGSTAQSTGSPRSTPATERARAVLASMAASESTSACLRRGLAEEWAALWVAGEGLPARELLTAAATGREARGDGVDGAGAAGSALQATTDASSGSATDAGVDGVVAVSAGRRLLSLAEQDWSARADEGVDVHARDINACVREVKANLTRHDDNYDDNGDSSDNFADNCNKGGLDGNEIVEENVSCKKLVNSDDLVDSGSKHDDNVNKDDDNYDISVAFAEELSMAELHFGLAYLSHTSVTYHNDTGADAAADEHVEAEGGEEDVSAVAGGDGASAAASDGYGDGAGAGIGGVGAVQQPGEGLVSVRVGDRGLLSLATGITTSSATTISATSATTLAVGAAATAAAGVRAGAGAGVMGVGVLSDDIYAECADECELEYGCEYGGGCGVDDDGAGADGYAGVVDGMGGGHEVTYSYIHTQPASLPHTTSVAISPGQVYSADTTHTTTTPATIRTTLATPRAHAHATPVSSTPAPNVSIAPASTSTTPGPPYLPSPPPPLLMFVRVAPAVTSPLTSLLSSISRLTARALAVLPARATHGFSLWLSIFVDAWFGFVALLHPLLSPLATAVSALAQLLLHPIDAASALYSVLTRTEQLPAYLLQRAVAFHDLALLIYDASLCLHPLALLPHLTLPLPQMHHALALPPPLTPTPCHPCSLPRLSALLEPLLSLCFSTLSSLLVSAAHALARGTYAFLAIALPLITLPLDFLAANPTMWPLPLPPPATLSPLSPLPPSVALSLRVAHLPRVYDPEASNAEYEDVVLRYVSVLTRAEEHTPNTTSHHSCAARGAPYHPRATREVAQTQQHGRQECGGACVPRACGGQLCVCVSALAVGLPSSQLLDSALLYEPADDTAAANDNATTATAPSDAARATAGEVCSCECSAANGSSGGTVDDDGVEAAELEHDYGRLATVMRERNAGDAVACAPSTDLHAHAHVLPPLSSSAWRAQVVVVSYVHDEDVPLRAGTGMSTSTAMAMGTGMGVGMGMGMGTAGPGVDDVEAAGGVNEDGSMEDVASDVDARHTSAARPPLSSISSPSLPSLLQLAIAIRPAIAACVYSHPHTHIHTQTHSSVSSTLSSFTSSPFSSSSRVNGTWPRSLCPVASRAVTAILSATPPAPTPVTLPGTSTATPSMASRTSNASTTTFDDNSSGADAGATAAGSIVRGAGALVDAAVEATVVDGVGVQDGTDDDGVDVGACDGDNCEQERVWRVLQVLRHAHARTCTHTLPSAAAAPFAAEGAEEVDVSDDGEVLGDWPSGLQRDPSTRNTTATAVAGADDGAAAALSGAVGTDEAAIDSVRASSVAVSDDSHYHHHRGTCLSHLYLINTTEVTLLLSLLSSTTSAPSLPPTRLTAAPRRYAYVLGLACAFTSLFLFLAARCCQSARARARAAAQAGRVGVDGREQRVVGGKQKRDRREAREVGGRERSVHRDRRERRGRAVREGAAVDTKLSSRGVAGGVGGDRGGGSGSGAPAAVTTAGSVVVGVTAVSDGDANVCAVAAMSMDSVVVGMGVDGARASHADMHTDSVLCIPTKNSGSTTTINAAGDVSLTAVVGVSTSAAVAGAVAGAAGSLLSGVPSGVPGSVSSGSECVVSDLVASRRASTAAAVSTDAAAAAPGAGGAAIATALPTTSPLPPSDPAMPHSPSSSFTAAMHSLSSRVRAASRASSDFISSASHLAPVLWPSSLWRADKPNTRVIAVVTRKRSEAPAPSPAVSRGSSVGTTRVHGHVAAHAHAHSVTATATADSRRSSITASAVSTTSRRSSVVPHATVTAIAPACASACPSSPLPSSARPSTGSCEPCVTVSASPSPALSALTPSPSPTLHSHSHCLTASSSAASSSAASSSPLSSSPLSSSLSPPSSSPSSPAPPALELGEVDEAWYGGEDLWWYGGGADADVPVAITRAAVTQRTGASVGMLTNADIGTGSGAGAGASVGAGVATGSSAAAAAAVLDPSLGTSTASTSSAAPVPASSASSLWAWASASLAYPYNTYNAHNTHQRRSSQPLLSAHHQVLAPSPYGASACIDGGEARCAGACGEYSEDEGCDAAAKRRRVQ